MPTGMPKPDAAAGTRAGPSEARIDRRSCAGGVTGRTPEAIAVAAPRRSRSSASHVGQPSARCRASSACSTPSRMPREDAATSSSNRSLCAIASTPKVRAQPLPKFHQSEPDARLDGPERRPRPVGDLLLRQALEVRELERPPLVLGQLPDGAAADLLPTRGRPRRPRRRPSRRGLRRCPRGCAARGARPDLRERTRSIARLRVAISSQVRTLPRDGSNEADARHAKRKTSCSTSSASPLSPRMRRASPSRRAACRS